MLPHIPAEAVVHICSIAVTDQLAELASEIHPAISEVLSEFALVFGPVDGLHPARAFDHSLPLVAGAKPVYIRTYRYPPALKDETEKQVQEMLDKGLIQPSSTPFSSPLLLVKKKDGS